MRRELFASALLHILLFVFLVFVTAPDASLPPPIPADQVMNVTPVDALPAASLAQASEASGGAEAAPAPDVTEGVKIPVKPPSKTKETKPKPVTKPKPKPEPAKPKPQPKVEAEVTAPDGQTDVAGTGDHDKPKAEVYEAKVQTGTGAPGGSNAGLQGGTPGGRPSSYPDRVTNKIYYTWKNPAKLLLSTSCSVVFRIDPSGQASQVALEQSSGMAVFDNSTVRAVYEAAPYPPFPRGMNEQYIIMRVTFEYLP